MQDQTAGSGEGALDQIKRLTAENERMAAVEAEIMQLLKTTSRERIIHDLRNVLNELGLLQALLASQEEE
jgi:hypothetical protein